ncbi:CBS domain-containing protein [Hyunsoonleella flava]|uniref:CBS domain-containing protein n=1 Tax=Hyunsoonleella flava TaxID=2527939 RepID=A0A4Q9FJS0_9FLAO|nr:CBS domain-containing protein [Hyunsoonleella flava]TBN04007.1 CBS domain-containing protein [Hyunsoonleella flava]
MGNMDVKKLKKKKDRANYVHHLLNDIRALDLMLEKGMIETDPIRIGAEQEFCLVKPNFSPSSNALEILNDIDDDHFTTEIGNYNLEANLDPIELKGDCFSKLHKQLKKLLKKAEDAAAKKNTKIVLTGILPSIGLHNIGESQMTPLKRYTVLNEAIKDSRKQDFNIHIQGVDELNLLFDSVMLEGCNTSFQMHLQVNPSVFIDTYNWAQAIAGPILSACTNSPLLFGKELWSETRIALFTQSIDTRANSFLLNENQSRVSFGRNWYTGSVTDIFKDNISRFRSFLTSDYIKDSVDLIENGQIPRLLALQLHNGTVYPWNRVCYGVGNNIPHLRIENRYIPSGPTVVDEIANMVFWVGVMMGKPKKYNNIHKRWDFKDVKTNFFNAARYGMAAQIYWDGKYISCLDLILDELLPMAYKGLYKFGIAPADAEYYLAIIKNRVTGLNGSEWTIRSYRHLLRSHKRFEAMQILTSKLYEKQKHDYPVSTWRILQETTELPDEESRVVKHIMRTDVFSVYETDSIELVLNIMQWKDIHHMPVISHGKVLIGVLSWKDIKAFKGVKESAILPVGSIMTKEVIAINDQTKIPEAKALMKANNINFLPITKNNKLIGLITSSDL